MTLTGNYDKLNKANAEKESQSMADEKEIELYPTLGQARNLCFVQLDGSKFFLNYAYLVSGTYTPQDNSITLTYATHSITLAGRNLEALYEQLNSQQPKIITCVDKRYMGTKNEVETVVTEINIVSLNDT